MDGGVMVPQTEEQMLATLRASIEKVTGRRFLGVFFERVEMKGGGFKTCRIEAWSDKGEVRYGQIVEVLE